MGYLQSDLKKFYDKVVKNRKMLHRLYMKQRYYNNLYNDKDYYNINKVFEKFKNKTVLDIGCHLGFYSILISSFADFIFGMDKNRVSIKDANYFKKVTRAKNTKFIQKSAFDLDDNFMKDNKINAIFIHKTYGYWSIEDFEKVFSLLEKYCDIIVCNKEERVIKFFNRSEFIVKEYLFYKDNYVCVIEKLGEGNLD